jgi:DNA mismatch repair protein MutL
MSRIRILPEHIANKIAAGEVVERPASVAKELLENAIDAGGRKIYVEVESGGKRMIRVIDDGVGMNRDDSLVAFERHATSKLRNAEDLLSISTLGFRGEALPAIASVSRLVLESRVAEEGEGTRVEFSGGKLVSVKPAGVPVGTSVSVGDIFFCVPARRKFLKSETTELGHIASLVTHYALANPECAFVLKTPSQEILNVSPVERLADRVYQVFGRQALEDLVEIPAADAAIQTAITEPEADEGGGERGRVRVTGFVSRPEVQRANRNGIYVFVNRRLVRDRLILHAINEAYRNILPSPYFPSVLLFLETPTEEVDVNVHPAKIEVRFRHPQFLHDFVRNAVRRALSVARPIPDFRPAGGVEERSFAPSAGAGMNAGADGGSGIAATAADSGGCPPKAVIPATLAEAASMVEDFLLEGAPQRATEQRLAFEPGAALSIPVAKDSAAAGQMVGNALPQANESGGSLPQPGEIGQLKPLGQVNSSFIVAVGAGGLWIIDQHVAHERVLFEQHLRARQEGALGGQRLLAPLVVELSPRQLATLVEIGEELRANGFEAEAMGPRSVAIQSAPAGIGPGDAEKLLGEILDGVGRESQAISIDSLQSQIAASTACHAAIKVNTPLESTKMEWLLAELAKTSYPMSCPHGRPVVLRYTMREIERAFKRI